MKKVAKKGWCITAAVMAVSVIVCIFCFVRWERKSSDLSFQFEETTYTYKDEYYADVLHLSILHRAVRRLQSVDGPIGNHLPCRVALGDAALGGRVEILPVVLVLHLPVGILVHGVLIVVGTGNEAQHACQQGQQGEQVFECLHLMLLCKIRPATPLPNQ